ncbi:TetR/AcrR family transcriptional regulator [uncultured Thalassolituus sp.]|uniref:TetR/AcrR family transcriptional regulator n=1 Tax=uncultured Thalassolituus sp. TaxID=285273 RepID=UPI002604322A|nr:TetR/AcrR family transcriptional regulator [uncultured Thalassolituus sp.]
MTEQTVNHRTRVGQERREKMRRRLLESALGVFAEKGIDGTVIDDFISAAGVSRGTFYNYFKTPSDLVTAIGELLSNELVHLIEEHVEGMDNPSEILATGLRLFLKTTHERPTLARFFWRAGFNINATGHLIYQYLPVHIGRALENRSIKAADIPSALEVIVGIMLATMFAYSNRQTDAHYSEQMIAHCFRALGVDEKEITRLLTLSLPDITLPEDSMLQSLALVSG